MRIPDRPFNRPHHLLVPVDPECYIVKIQMNTIAAGLPWFVCGISLEGELVGASPGAKRLARGIPVSERIGMVEKKLDRIFRILAVRKGPALKKSKPPAPSKSKGEKTAKKKKA